MSQEVRSGEQRLADTTRRLETEADIWVASAQGGVPHLVPLSFSWDGSRIILATPSHSPTARNASASGVLRLALGPTRDVTVFEASTAVVPCRHADLLVGESFCSRVGWDPRDEEIDHSFLIATPRVARAWRSVPELRGRTIMRDGLWLRS